MIAEFVNSGSLVFDIGANHGLFARECLDLGARVVCVEPQDALCDDLRSLGCEVMHAAVGASQGILTLHTSDDSRYTSARAGWVDGHKAYHQWTTSNTITVPTVTLDSLIRQYGIPDFIKVDTEGFEDEVMAGLSTPVRAMSLEYHGDGYAVPAALGVTARALHAAAQLDGGYRFRFAAESTRWVSDWLDLDGALDTLRWVDWGDIYVTSEVGR